MCLSLMSFCPLSSDTTFAWNPIPLLLLLRLFEISGEREEEILLGDEQLVAQQSLLIKRQYLFAQRLNCFVPIAIELA